MQLQTFEGKWPWYYISKVYTTKNVILDLGNEKINKRVAPCTKTFKDYVFLQSTNITSNTRISWVNFFLLTGCNRFSPWSLFPLCPRLPSIKCEKKKKEKKKKVQLRNFLHLYLKILLSSFHTERPE